MKRFISTAIAIVILILLTVLSINQVQMGDKKAVKIDRLLTFDTINIRKISINSSELFKIFLEKDEGGQWIITEPYADFASNTAIMNLLIAIKAIVPSRAVEKPQDLEEYGLDKPIVAISLIFEDQKAFDISIGDLTPDNKGRFLCFGDQIIRAYAQEIQPLLIKLDDLRDKALIRQLYPEDIAYLRLSWPEKMLAFKKVDDNWLFSGHLEGNIADKGIVEKLIAGISASQAVEFVHDIENIRDPWLTVFLSDEKGKSHELFFGDTRDKLVLTEADGKTVLTEGALVLSFPPDDLYYHDRIVFRPPTDFDMLEIIKPGSHHLLAKKNDKRQWLMEIPENFTHSMDNFNQRVNRAIPFLLTVISPQVSQIKREDWPKNMMRILDIGTPINKAGLTIYKDSHGALYLARYNDKERPWLYLMPTGFAAHFANILKILDPHGNSTDLDI